MPDGPKSIAFIEPYASDRFVITLRSASDLSPIAVRIVEQAACLHDVHATIAELVTALETEFSHLACTVLFTGGALTAKTVEPQQFSQHRAPVYCLNRSSALAWGAPDELCRFVLVDCRWPGSVTLIKRDADGLIDDVRQFDESIAGIAGIVGLSPKPGSMTDDLHATLDDERVASWLAGVLRVTNGFGYASPVFVSEAFDGAERNGANYHPRDLLHRGAVRAIKARARKPGVWADPLSNVDAFTMRTFRDISYSVVQLQRAVYDGDEPALATLLGDSPALVAVDTVVDEIYGDRLRRYLQRCSAPITYVTLDGGEANKSHEQVDRLERACSDAGIPRRGTVVGVGGGVVLDIAGMAASHYRRGVSYIRVATTLLAMIDVAVGIKHAVNLGGKKNISGTFYPPAAAINDPLFLRSNSPRQLACGVAEAIKIALVADPRLFELLEQHLPALMESGFQAPPDAAREILKRSQIAMMTELAPNLFETDLKRAVDFGHSISPQLEAESHYTIAHGEAVAIDMLLCTAIAVRRGICDSSLFERLQRMYRVCGLPANDPRCTVAFLRRALHDVTAHRGGNLHLLVPIEPGRYQFLQHVGDRDLRFAVYAVNSQALAVAQMR